MWKPGFSLSRKSVQLPSQARVESIRRPAGLVEMFMTNPDCSIVTVRAEDVTVELAIVIADVPTALQSLSSGVGAQWGFGDRRLRDSTPTWGRPG